MDAIIEFVEEITSISGVAVTPLKIIGGDKGRVFHGIKAIENSYAGFGEAYFSEVLYKQAKGWKRHNRMVLNLVVPVGAIKFHLFDQQSGIYSTLTLGVDHLYARLTVQPGLWMAFEGIGEAQNLLMNFASIAHDPTEADAVPLSTQGFPLLVSGI